MRRPSRFASEYLLWRQALRRGLLGVFLLLATAWAAPSAWALQGAVGSHDPSTIIKSGNRYWIFTTGRGIYAMYSTDLVRWTPGPRAVFENNAYPGWINTKVPDFAGDFWAPECVFQNGKYYLYYSCSTFGSKVSAIGLATNVTLDPSSPNYRWVDEGEVISSNASSAANAIDPAIYRDASNNLWMTYGSYFGGIRNLQLDATTGKPLAGTTQYAVANGGVEAAYVKRNGAFYYLFINRGTCCQGASSTYFIQVGRSASPSGPFLDKTGVDLNNNGGTTLLSGSGRYRGPGHTGIFEENGVSYFTHHYYDSYAAGAPKLGIAKLTWDAAGWPEVTRDWVAPGRYEIVSRNNGLAWAAGCAGGATITQVARTGQACQRWDFAALGNGEYKLTNATGGLAASVANCSAANGSQLLLSAYAGDECQQFRVDRNSEGTLVLASVNGNRVVEIPFASGTLGTALALFDYNDCTCQQWTLSAAEPLATASATLLAGVSIYPIPASRGIFTLDLSGRKSAGPVTVEVLDLQGRVVYRRVVEKPQAIEAVAAGLLPGLFVVQVRQGTGLFTQKLTVL